MNSTLISLIPKMKSLEVVAHLRPISLCNMNYKVVTKVIVNRLRPLLNELVGPEQASFISWRQSCDNVIIIQELLHIMRKMKGKNGAMIIKIDLEKAYDRVMWDFLHQTLEWASIPHELIKLIMNCVQVEATAILWNGEKSKSFVPSKGLRQGDPLSPYIFVFCMECLSYLILQATKGQQWRGVKTSRVGPRITHIMFADDLLLCAEATPLQGQIVRSIMVEFCGISGQKINMDKSKFVYSQNVKSTVVKEISKIIGINETKNLGKYLGVPLFHSRVTKGMFQPLLDRVRMKLAGWKNPIICGESRLS